jgi:bacteriocin-like protein
VLPAQPAGDGELTDSELAAVSGGASAAVGEKASGGVAKKIRQAGDPHVGDPH